MGQRPPAFSLVSELADSTCRSLMNVCSDFERGQYILGAPLPTGNDPRVLESIARCIVATEFFVFSRVLEMVDEYVTKSENRILSALYKQQATKIDSSWQSTINAARDYLDLDILAIAPYDRLMAYVEVRNAVMHGNGSLTRRQLRDTNVIKKLELIHVRVLQGRLEAEPRRLLNAARDCRSFVVGLDGITWSPPPMRW